MTACPINLIEFVGKSSAEQGGNQMSSSEYAKRFLPHEDAPLVAREIKLAMDSVDPQFTCQLEHRIIRADGEERYISVRFEIVKDATGRTIKTYGANQDITEQKLAEKERSKLESQLLCLFTPTAPMERPAKK